jgi:hypothetical protein
LPSSDQALEGSLGQNFVSEPGLDFIPCTQNIESTVYTKSKKGMANSQLVEKFLAYFLKVVPEREDCGT